MKVIGVRHNPGRGSELVDRLYGPEDFHAALGEADFVILALPLTHETANIMDRRAFDSLKSGARLVNVARGALIDLEALYDALEDGRLAEFGTDCWWHYQDKIPQYHYPIPEVDLVKLPQRDSHGGSGFEFGRRQRAAHRLWYRKSGCFCSRKARPPHGRPRPWVLSFKFF
jgi:lactate dehydrogenase-like 2-hydroxyacid dehydrogenase